MTTNLCGSQLRDEIHQGRKRRRGLYHVQLASNYSPEISPEASQKKLLLVYRIGSEIICQSLMELSRNLFDIETWQHYRDAGYDSFESYCEGALGIPATKIQGLMLVEDKCLPRPKKAGPPELFSWFFEIVELLAKAKLV